MIKKFLISLIFLLPYNNLLAAIEMGELNNVGYIYIESSECYETECLNIESFIPKTDSIIDLEQKTQKMFELNEIDDLIKHYKSLLSKKCPFELKNSFSHYIRVRPNDSCSVSQFKGGTVISDYKKARILSYYKSNDTLFALIYAFNEPSNKDLIKEYEKLNHLKKSKTK